MKNAKPITASMIESFRTDYEANVSAKIATAAASKTEISAAVFDKVKAAKLLNSFTIDIPTSGAMEQKMSGRCWLFASMNLMREIVAKKCNVPHFELSTNYISFWDKFEKINYFLEAFAETADLEPSDRTLNWIFHGFIDGGQWDMMVSLVKKYGVVPMEAMPETAQSVCTRNSNTVLNTKLRHDGMILRRMVKEGKDITATKERMLGEYFRALCIIFGEPPQTFEFAYDDRDKKHHVDYDITPLEFYEKYVGLALDDYVSVINAPTGDKPYGRTYTVKYLGNVVEGGICYLNLPMEELKRLTIEQMESGEPVWFGSDCGKFGNRDEGIWDPEILMYEEFFGVDLSLSKEEMLDFCDSQMNHAMLLCGVNLDKEGNPDRWKIENSWGEKAGKKGYFIASDKWFDLYTYQVIINKKFLTEEQRAALLEEPIELEPWDPMGSLA